MRHNSRKRRQSRRRRLGRSTKVGSGGIEELCVGEALLRVLPAVPYRGRADCGRLELRPLARKGASRPMARNTAPPCRGKLSGQPARPEIEGISFVAPNYGPVVQYCIKPCARAQCHRISSCQSCGSFGRRVRTTAPTHLGMPLYRCPTVGSPDAPPVSPEWHSSGTRAVLQGAHRPNLCTVDGDGASADRSQTWHHMASRVRCEYSVSTR